MKTKTIRESILDGTFNLKGYNEVAEFNYIHPKQKGIENLESWKRFYLNRCTDGTGVQVETINKKTNQSMMVDVQVSRKVPFLDHMFIPKYKGEPFSFIHNYKERGEWKYIKTSKDKLDDALCFTVELDIKRFWDKNQENKRRSSKRN